MPDPTDQLDIFEDIVYGAEQTAEFVIETRRGDLVFELVRVERRVRNRVLSSLPADFFGSLEDLDTGDVADADDPSEVDLSDADLDDVDVSDLAFPEEATEAWNDMIVRGLEHDELSDSEIRQLVKELPDDVWYGAGSEVLNHSMQGGRVEGFRS